MRQVKIYQLYWVFLFYTLIRYRIIFLRKNSSIELCHVNKGTEIHHLQFQKNSDEKGFIDKSFRKNHKANIVNICEECHNKIHNSDTQHKISKTSVGYEIMELV